MARARNIKPAFFKNEDLGTADPFVSLLFAGLWTLADRKGILEDRPLRIKAELFPYRDNFDINGYLTVLVSLGFIRRYEVDGLKLIYILNFSKHQNPHHTEKDSEYPEYSDRCNITVTTPLNNGIAPADSLLLIPDSLIPDSLNTYTPSNLTIAKEFEIFWKQYPKKEGKKPCKEIWIRIKPDLDAVLSALLWQKQSKRWMEGFIPNPKTYLNQERWLDEPSIEPSKKESVQESKLNMMKQFGDKYGNDTKNASIIYGTTQRGNEESVPQIGNSLREFDGK